MSADHHGQRPSPAFGFVMHRWGLRAWYLCLMQAFAVIALTCPAAHALPAQYNISQLYHTQWTVHDGVPTGIEAIAQTSDGFLWLGTSGGLFRFDGVAFERFSGTNAVALLSQDIFSLHATPEDGLWIGHHLGGISHLQGGHLVNYGRAEGLPASSVTAIGHAGDGTVWAGTTRGLFRLERGLWQLAGAAWNAPTDPLEALVVDRDRTLWVKGNEQIFYLRDGATRFEKMPIALGKSNFITMLLAPGGAAMLCTSGHVRTLALKVPLGASALVPEWHDRQVSVSEEAACAFDREGHLWVGGSEGAGRFPPPSENTASTVKAWRGYKTDLAPLTGESVSAALEDLEGNLWFATRAGLDRFRAPALLKLPLDVGSNEFSLAPAGERDAWIGTSRGNIFRAGPASQAQIDFNKLASVGVDTVYSSAEGSLWVAGGDSIWELQPDRHWRRSARPGAQGGPAAYAYSNIQTMTQDAHGAMWVSVLRVGVYRVVGDAWTLWGGRTDMPTQNTTALFTDAQGRVWFGYDDGTVAVLDSDRLTIVTSPRDARPQANLGAVNSFVQQGSHIWVGAEKGLWHLEGRVLRPITGTRGAFIGVSGIVPGSNDDLWLSTVDGVVHIAADELAQALGRPEHPVRHALLNHLDGLPGLPATAMGNGGRIWFSTVNGVVWTEPSRMPRNAVAPSVMVKTIVADGISYAFEPDVPTQLPMHTRDLKITYTAPSLTMPERVMFRYRLGEANAEWQEVGTRREAYFRDLPPGHHRFQVLAANNDGLWNETGASIDFVIPPTFVQTPWFLALCGAAAAAALGWLYWLRLRAVKARLRLRLEERMVERERIARELHDTFLQAVNGLVLRFHAVMEQIPSQERARGLMQDALDCADEVIADGRDAVTDLRLSTDRSMGFSQDLRLIGERWSQDSGVSFDMSIDGPVRELDPVAVQECQRVATEAMSNAFRHAQGTRVQLHMAYGPKQFLLQVSDDGHGFDANQPHARRWGLVGLRERADRLNGRLRVSSGERGTTVALEVPARIAYKRWRRTWVERLIGVRGRLARFSLRA
ncbi:MAG TPA: triple tyrosine motif-containing protein [Ideonella sp.]|uniref:sensor histidine kinase n=1 Tax=Ideonella sp. TaxID=1929293 RepID=UPI002B9F2E45|nr:triple tyrosine motif-containing protein [Ideonella sp.]